MFGDLRFTMKEYFKGIKSKTAEATKNPGAVFGLLYPYVLVVGLAIGIYYVQNLDNISQQKVPPVIPDSTVVGDIPFKKATLVPPLKIQEVSKPTAELTAEGEKLYKTNCASCHGENGAGGGPASIGLNPAPRNFTSKDNWKNGTKISNIYQTLQEGLLPSAMVSYEFLLPEQKFALAHYLRNTFIPDPSNDSEVDLQTLDATYNLSAGLQLAAQIPVKDASNLLIDENQPKISKIELILSNLDKYKSDYGFNIFSKVVIDRKVALSFLSKSSNWKVNENEFVNFIVNNVNQNGFNGSVFNLKNDEWNSLYSLMLKMI